MDTADIPVNFPAPDGFTPSIMLTGNPDQWLKSKKTVKFN